MTERRGRWRPGGCSAGTARGFTLVEVLVAVGVVALVLPALLLVLRERAVSASELRDRSLAQWVASNVVAEMRIARLSGTSSDWVNDGVEEMAGRRWHWTVRQEATSAPGFWRIEVSVGPEDSEQTVQTLTAFIHQPPGLSGPGR